MTVNNPESMYNFLMFLFLSPVIIGVILFGLVTVFSNIFEKD